jgi:hypothetical protein
VAAISTCLKIRRPVVLELGQELKGTKKCNCTTCQNLDIKSKVIIPKPMKK